ncbi:MAG: N-6 DNA methylase [Patescibacteria group bacterium]
MTTEQKQNTLEIINKIFRDADVLYGLTEFADVKPEESLNIFEKDGKFYLKCLKREKDIQIYNLENNSGNPEEIIRQLWLYKLVNYYKYPIDRIEVEKDVHFGSQIRARIDIIVYHKDKITPHIVIETKKPREAEGIDQLKSYLSSEGAPIGVWSNGDAKVVLYRPYPREYETLREIPRVDQTIEDVLEEKLTLVDLKPDYDLRKIILALEELVLAGSGADSFNEIFKLIYAKLYDEKKAENRKDQEVYFRKSKDPKVTYDNINDLFKESIDEWPGIFNKHEKIELSPVHLSICVPELEKIKLFGAQLPVMDQAFEYLLTTVAKGSKGQYFTPRNVIDMTVKMLNPKENEYVIDPACGSGGFLIHTMWWVWQKYLADANSNAKSEYAKRYIYGIDFDEKTVKISRALMLIAGDGKSHIFKLNSLDTREWQGDEQEKERARADIKNLLHEFKDTQKDRENSENLRSLDFDVLLANPPFAGEQRDQVLFKTYDLAKNEKGKLKNTVERHILFIERALEMVKPEGRIGIVLPQGVLNNTNMSYIRNWLFDKARILAVVGLDGNTFKPHTGTKTSVLFLQKWGESEKPLNDYPIFMAVSKKSGKDNSGNPVYKKDETGNPIFKLNAKALDDDLDEIANVFVKFAKEEGFKFWRHYER